MSADSIRCCVGLRADTNTTSDVAAALASLRLGKHERRILLLAPPPYADGRYIEPPAPGRGAEEAHRRAIRRLSVAGLISYGFGSARRYVPGVGWRPLHDVRLTTLGAALVTVLRRELEAGVAIRWAAHIDAIAGAVPPIEAEIDAFWKRSDERLAGLIAQMAAARAGGLEALLGGAK